MHTQTTFFSMFVSVVLGLVFLVMGVAFVTIPYNLGSHPGEPQRSAVEHLT
jgi:hypothetical protein